MTNDLIRTNPQRAPATQTRADADLLGRYRSKITLASDGVSWLITEGDEPRGADLVALQARRAELAAFEPAEDRAIAARLARLFLRFPVTATKGSPEQVAAYVVDLKRFPLWAIEGGIAAIISGQAMKEVAFAPSSLEVQKAVRKVLEPFQTEFAMIGNVLNATVVKRVELSAEDRSRIVGDWKKRGLAKDDDAA